jgi:(heptosyl)LPS beta-1,4-glucosyltransferase
MAQDTSATHNQNASYSISALIIVRNEEDMIANCIETLRWANEVIVLDTGSTDRTRELAKHAGARVEQAHGKNFADWRNEIAEHATSTWLFYVDADERVTPQLAQMIQNRIHRTEIDAYTVRRHNIHYGRWMQFGGWQNDQLLRIMKKSQLKSWVGEVHEHAEIVGRVDSLEEPLIHLTHRSMYDGLKKSVEWTDTEAKLFLDAGHPPITPLRLIKIVTFDFLNRMIFKKAWKDGTEGTLEAMIQTMNRFLVYVRLWELQQKPPISQRYDRIEQEIQKQWLKKGKA